MLSVYGVSQYSQLEIYINQLAEFETIAPAMV